MDEFRRSIPILNEKDGGSKASYFIARAMAETKNRNGNYVPPFSDVAGVDFDAKKMKKSSAFIKKHFGDKPVAWKGVIRPPPPTEEETREAVEESKRRNKDLKKIKDEYMDSIEEDDDEISIPIIRKMLERVKNNEPYTHKKHLGVLTLLGVKPSYVRTYNKEQPYKDVFYSSYEEFKDMYDSLTKKRKLRLPKEETQNVVIPSYTEEQKEEAKKEAEAEAREETAEERKRRRNRERNREYRQRKTEKEGRVFKPKKRMG